MFMCFFAESGGTFPKMDPPVAELLRDSVQSTPPFYTLVTSYARSIRTSGVIIFVYSIFLRWLGVLCVEEDYH